MKIDVNLKERAYHYKLHLDEDDFREGKRVFEVVNNEQIKLVGDEYDVILPPEFQGLHPDAHAAAIWRVLWPFITSRLELPFEVSEYFAEKMQTHFQVTFPRVNTGLKPRISPRKARPGLLFSGGVDSLAAHLILPRDTAILVMDRIPHFINGAENTDSLIDLVHSRAVCALIAKQGAQVYTVKDDHEFLLRPYPTWHSTVYSLPALYMADSLDLGLIETGDVLCVMHFGGYYSGSVESWKFRKFKDKGENHCQPGNGEEGAEARQDLMDDERFNKFDLKENAFADLYLVGMGKVTSSMGLSEVATAKIVNRSPFKGRAFSCYYKSETNYCMKCDKCFKKLLLDYALDGREVPAELFGHFLSYPHLAEIFRRPYFDWHHIWYYLFQQMKCRHPFAEELRRQARQGPDLTLLEKWYPRTGNDIPSAYRPVVVENINRYTETMNAEEMTRLESLDIPPLHAPELKTRTALYSRTSGQNGINRSATGATTDEETPSQATGSEEETSAWAKHTSQLTEWLSLEELTSQVAQALNIAAEGGFTTGYGIVKGPAETGEGAVSLTLGRKEARIDIAILGRKVPWNGKSDKIYYNMTARFHGDAEQPGEIRLLRVIATFLDFRSECNPDEQEWREIFSEGAPLLCLVENALIKARSALEAQSGFSACWPTLLNDGKVQLSLFKGEEWLDLFLGEREGNSPCFRATENTALSYFNHTPVDSPEKEGAIGTIVNHLKALEKLAEATPGDPQPRPAVPRQP